MNISEEMISKVAPKAGDILVVRLSEQDAQAHYPRYVPQLKSLAKAASDAAGAPVPVMLVVGATSVQALSEEEMRKLGWVRAEANDNLCQCVNCSASRKAGGYRPCLKAGKPTNPPRSE